MSMTFDEWLDQATETEKRQASFFIHHFPLEISVMEVDMNELGDDATIEDALAALKSPRDWPTKTVCGCDPMGQYTYGEDEHVPEGAVAEEEPTLSEDDFAKLLGHDTSE